MFYTCSSLEKINLSNFDTTLIGDFINMFAGCALLTNIDISNFKYKSVFYDKTMFDGCTSLIYLNSGKKQKTAYQAIDIFRNTHNNLIICSEYSEWNNMLSTDEFRNINISCGDNSNGYTCYIKKNIELTYNKYVCNNLCGNNFYQMNNIDYISCIELQNGYFLDNNYENDYPLRSCYSTCSKCDQGGNEFYHNCIECNNNFKYQFIIDDNYFNCYNNCQFYYYTNVTTNKIYCTQNLSCPDNYILNTDDDKECLYNIDIPTSEITDYISNIKSEQNTELTDLTSIITNMTENVNEKIKYLFENVNETELNNGKDAITEIKNKLEDGKIYVTLTTTENQRNKENENVTSINLKECENDLRRYYMIYNEKLYMIKIDKEIIGMKIPKIEYKIFYKNVSGNYIKLNLSVIEGCKVDISIPVNINDDIEKYDTKSDYYNDKCSKATSNKGTDITLSDRQNIFIDNNMTLCEEGCKLSSYNKTSTKVKCSCEIKIKLPIIEDIKFDKNKLKDSFIDIKSIMNLDVMKCYKIVFNSSLKNNYGFYIILFKIVLYITCLITFISFGKKFILTNISQIVSAKIELENENINIKPVEDKDNKSIIEI